MPTHKHATRMYARLSAHTQRHKRAHATTHAGPTRIIGRSPQPANTRSPTGFPWVSTNVSSTSSAGPAVAEWEDISAGSLIRR